MKHAAMDGFLMTARQRVAIRRLIGPAGRRDRGRVRLDKADGLGLDRRLRQGK